MQARKCFGCGEFDHIARNCRIREEKEVITLQSLNKFEALASRVVNMGKGSGREVKKDKKMMLREERARRRKKSVEVRKAEEGKLLRKVTVKIGLERIDTQEKIIMEVLLDSGAIKLIMSSEFARK